MKIIFHNLETDLFTYLVAKVYINYSKNRDINIKKIIEKKPTLKQPTGTLIYIGNDSLENKVYILGRKRKEKIVCQALMGFSRAFNSSEKFCFFDLSNYNNMSLKLALFLSHFNLKHLNQIYYYGINKEYNRILNDIKNFYRKIKDRGR